MDVDDDTPAHKDILIVTEIDAFWLQRLLSKHHTDAIDAQVG